MIYLDFSLLLLSTVFLAAVLYSSVGHGGASGYLAAMALFGLDVEVMRPAALIMNIFVTAFIIWRNRESSVMSWRLFLPLMAASLPSAYIGGTIHIQDVFYKAAVGGLLILASVRMFWVTTDRQVTKKPRIAAVLLVGVVLGFTAGLTGVGGGIYLSPLLLLLGWSTIQGSIPIVAAFIFFNSAAGFAGYLSVSPSLPPGIETLVIIALAGAVVGTRIASMELTGKGLKTVLGVVLAVAGSKMMLSEF